MLKSKIKIAYLVLILAPTLLINGCNTTKTADSDSSTTSTTSEISKPQTSNSVYEEVIVTAQKRGRVESRRERRARLRREKRARLHQEKAKQQQRERELESLVYKAQNLDQRKSAQDPEPAFEDINVVKNKSNPSMIFKNYGVNPTIDTHEENVSTFSADVDTASFNLAQAFLHRNSMPPSDSIRIEEFINYFDYDYTSSSNQAPFTMRAQAFPSPYRKGFHVLHVGLKANGTMRVKERANLTLLIDVSGSMASYNRIETVRQSIRQLVNELQPHDTLSIVSYSDNAELVLAPTDIKYKRAILRAIETLTPQSSTNAEAGLQLAYKIANSQFEIDRTNRIIMCSDGVANTGLTKADQIMDTISNAARKGVYLTTVGVGMDNYNDVLLEELAEHGQGQYTYIDSSDDAKHFFVNQLKSNLHVAAEDVKIQLKFDTTQVERYRLLGYENRELKNSDFLDAEKDAGEMGVGHTVTAIYEVKFKPESVEKNFGAFKISYKNIDSKQVLVIEKPLPYDVICDDIGRCSSPTQLSYLVAAFAEKLRGSYWSRTYHYDDLLDLYNDIKFSIPNRKQGKQLFDMIKTADKLDKRRDRYRSINSVSSMSFDHVPVIN